MADYDVTMTGADQLLSRITTLQELRPVRSLLAEASLIAQRTARQEAPKDTAALKRSILRDVQPLVATVSSSLPYAIVMEQGRAAGAAMPPPDALAGWAARHGFATDRGTLFVLARAIARRGIKGRFFMRAAAQAVEDAMPRLLLKLQLRLQAIWDTGAAGGEDEG